ncbi:hypothetical protein GCM10017772_12170 [Promicromonospora soli]|uniref:Ribosomal protein mS38 C-terminal domain-containing protein n=1 Tax=Promicromonospora soli TaxID=2035533 RepID=A0A919FMB7_9MICO|nr:hypothetical protein GCM10017772_12170 [Promicromonospora soli]
MLVGHRHYGVTVPDQPWTISPSGPVVGLPPTDRTLRGPMGSVIKKRRKRMAKKKHRKLLRKTRHQRRNKK